MVVITVDDFNDSVSVLRICDSKRSGMSKRLIFFSQTTVDMISSAFLVPHVQSRP